MLRPHEEDVNTKTHTDEMQCFYLLRSLPFSARTTFGVLTHLIWVTTQRFGWIGSNQGHVYRRQSLNQKQSLVFSCSLTTVKQEIQSFTDWEWKENYPHQHTRLCKECLLPLKKVKARQEPETVIIDPLGRFRVVVSLADRWHHAQTCQNSAMSHRKQEKRDQATVSSIFKISEFPNQQSWFHLRTGRRARGWTLIQHQKNEGRISSALC